MEAEEGTAEGEEGLMAIGAPLVAHGQAAAAIEPGQRALEHPAMPTEALAGVEAFAGDANADMPEAEGPTTPRDVIGLVSMQCVGALAPPTVGLFDRRDGIEQVLEDDGIVAIGSGHEGGEGVAA